MRTVTDPVRHDHIEVDVVVFAPAMPGERKRVLRLGGVKRGRRMGPGRVVRFDAKGHDVWDALTCCGGVGFDAAVAGESDVRRGGLEETYG
ncbi:hypothetical protein E1292_13030 [Nonomuraea deserti]|uniref:Uncharacterized protein n=1 Tax=Nonomuraea deserti TaxID=1848322 RepID=A0A4R4VPA0_9ACTN|nr:hypothetical protein [Nonomuraea deserti]TDD07679.1 hypothetical protein E1292_13030 [Nonomuraea deserti]